MRFDLGAKIARRVGKLGEEKELFLRAIFPEKLYQRLKLLVFGVRNFACCSEDCLEAPRIFLECRNESFLENIRTQPSVTARLGTREELVDAHCLVAIVRPIPSVQWRQFLCVTSRSSSPSP